MPKGRKKLKIGQPNRETPESKVIFQTPLSQSVNGHLQQDYEDNLSFEQEQALKQDEAKRENTLSILTRRFVKLIKSRSDFVLDINEAVSQLKVQKRRIYDITNVLQGIGYIEKIHKNKMRWIGGTMDIQLTKEIKQLDAQLANYIQKNKQIEQEMFNVSQQLKNITKQKQYLHYLVEDDLREIIVNIEEEPSSMIVISATQGTTMEIKQNKIIIEKDQKSSIGMTYCKVTKDKNYDDFDLHKF